MNIVSGSALQKLSNELREKADAKDDHIASLEARLSTEIDKRKQDKFLFVFAGILMANMLVLPKIPTEFGALGLIFLDVIALITCAKIFDIRQFEEAVDKAASLLPSFRGTKKENSK